MPNRVSVFHPINLERFSLSCVDFDITSHVRSEAKGSFFVFYSVNLKLLFWFLTIETWGASGEVYVGVENQHNVAVMLVFALGPSDFDALPVAKITVVTPLQTLDAG